MDCRFYYRDIDGRRETTMTKWQMFWTSYCLAFLACLITSLAGHVFFDLVFGVPNGILRIFLVVPFGSAAFILTMEHFVKEDRR